VPYEIVDEYGFNDLGGMDMKSPFFKASYSLFRQGEQRRQAWVAYFEEHPLVSLAAVDRHVGISQQTRANWMRKSPQFKRCVDEIRRRPKQDPERPFDAGRGDGFAEFRFRYFGMKTFPHQMEMVERIEGNKPLNVGLILAPPDHGKTSLLEDWICYKLALDPNLRFIIMSQSSEHAKEMIGRIKERMVDKEAMLGGDGLRSRYIDDWGPFFQEGQSLQGKPWAAGQFTVAKKNSNERSPSVLARGWSSKIQGKRCDYFIIDDVQDVDTLDKTKKIIEKIRQEGFTRVDPDRGSTTFLATRVGNDDIYDFMLDLPDGQRMLSWVVEYAAITPQGQALWPERWPLDKLALRREQVGEETWWRCYMQNPQGAGQHTFNPDVLKRCFNDQLKVGERFPDGLTVGGYDPALGGASTAVILSARSMDEIRFVDARCTYGFSRFEDIISDMEELTNWHDVDVWVFENNASQKGYIEMDQMRDLKNEHGFRLESHRTDGANKVDRKVGISAMPRTWWKGQFQVPMAGDVEKATFLPLIDQHEKWRPGVPDRLLKQDYVIATWLPWKYLMNELKKMQRQERRSSWDIPVASIGTPVVRSA
jgi:hypothetical protein